MYNLSQHSQSIQLDMNYMSLPSFRFLPSSLIPTCSYAKIHIPIIASVSEHQPTTWVSFFFDLHILVCTFPAGLWFCIKNINDERVFGRGLKWMKTGFFSVVWRMRSDPVCYKPPQMFLFCCLIRLNLFNLDTVMLSVFRLKHLNHYWVTGPEILCRHSWSHLTFSAPTNFLFYILMRFACVFLNE